jgi:hypothetical protein
MITENLVRRNIQIYLCDSPRFGETGRTFKFDDIIVVMSLKIETIGDLVDHLRRARLPGADFLRKVCDQGGRLTPEVINLARDGVEDEMKGRIFNAAMHCTSKGTHFCGKRKLLRQCEDRFESRR